MRKCPLCGSVEAAFCFRRKDLLAVHACAHCKLKFVAQEDFAGRYGETGKLYERGYFEGGGDFGFKEYQETPAENFYWQKSFIQIIEDIKGKRILDIGCGTGRLMELISRAGGDIEGVEISCYASGISSSRGFRIVGNEVSELEDRPSYDIIAAFDVLEHVPDIRGFLSKVRSLLKEGGVFVFLTPDAGSGKALAQKADWYGYNTSLEHLFYFSAESLLFLFRGIFGGDPILYQAAAPDGEGILGFIREKRSAADDETERMFKENFSEEFVSERNVIPVSILLQRLDDRRFISYAERFRARLAAEPGEEAGFLLSFIKDPAETEPLTSADRTQAAKEVIVRPYREGDEYGLVKLFGEVFGREMTIEEWKWKYRGQRINSVHAVAVVHPGDEIIGHNGGLAVRAVYSGSETRVLESCDTMISKRFRGFWLMKRIMALFGQETIKNGFISCHGFPTEKTFLMPAEKLRIIERCTDVSEAKKKLSFSNSPIRFGYKLAPLAFDDSRINGLWEDFKQIHDFAVVRDSEFFAWRYGSHPLFSYGLWGLSKRWGRDLLGVVVTKEDSAEKMSAVDMIFRPGALVPLLRKTENLAYSSGKRELALWMPERYHRVLAANGYTLAKCCVLARLVREELVTKSQLAADFYFTMGDTDYI